MMETHARDYEAATFNLNQTVAIDDKVPDHECTIMIDPEDPWKPKLIQSFLRKAPIPLPERQGYVEVTPDCNAGVVQVRLISTSEFHHSRENPLFCYAQPLTSTRLRCWSTTKGENIRNKLNR